MNFLSYNDISDKGIELIGDGSMKLHNLTLLNLNFG